MRFSTPRCRRRVAKAKRALEPAAQADAISRGFLDACLAELDALKPGNVHRHGRGHSMTVDDFVASAKAAAPIMGETELSVGQAHQAGGRGDTGGRRAEHQSRHRAARRAARRGRASTGGAAICKAGSAASCGAQRR